MPRSGSMCHASSLFLRTRPMSLAPADLRPVLTIGAAAELEEEDAGEADSGFSGDGRLDVAIAFFTVDELDAGRGFFAVDGGAEPAQILEEELAGGGVAAEAEVFAGDVREGFE